MPDLYDVASESLDGVARLRQFVLDIAMTGRLVPGESSWIEEPIEECLQVLGDGKKLHQGWSPQCEGEPSPDEECWGVLKTTSIQDGFFLEDQNKRLPARLEPKPRLEVEVGDLLLTCAGPRARCGVPCLVRATRSRLMISGKMYRFRAAPQKVAPEFLLLFLRSSETQQLINEMKSGSSESGLNLTQARFKTLSIRFPPLAEQRRIVAIVDTLMALCTRLEEAIGKRESLRDELTASSLVRLSKPDPDVESFVAHVRFVLKALPLLTARSHQVKTLRQTVLGLAVMGKLVAQDPTDGDVADLITSLSVVQQDLLAEGHLKRAVGKATLSCEQLPDLPPSWKWVPLGKLIAFGPQNGLSPKKSTSPDAPRAITLTATTSGRFDSSHFKHVEADVPTDSEYWLREGDLLFQRGNTREYVGMAAWYSGEADRFLYPDLMIKVRLLDGVCLRYVHLAMIAPSARAYFSTNAAGGQETMPKINQQTLLNAPVPIPPLREQRRIVEKFDELMAICDKLEDGLARSETTRTRLREAFLSKALAGGSSIADATPEALNSAV